MRSSWTLCERLRSQTGSRLRIHHNLSASDPPLSSLFRFLSLCWGLVKIIKQILLKLWCFYDCFCQTYAYQCMQWITMAVFYNQVPLADSILLSLFKFSSLLQSEVQPFLSKWCTVTWWHSVESSNLYNRINWELYWTKDECCI